jgi:predicted transposase YdaD
MNGNGRWVLPLPATYVIGCGGKIIYAHVEADYRVRAESSDVLVSIKVQNAQAQGVFTLDPVKVRIFEDYEYFRN